MTDPARFSEWQSASVKPQIKGVYERRWKMGTKWGELPLSRFKGGKWFLEKDGRISIWQTDAKSPWQWRGLI